MLVLHLVASSTISALLSSLEDSCLLILQVPIYHDLLSCVTCSIHGHIHRVEWTSPSCSGKASSSCPSLDPPPHFLFLLALTWGYYLYTLRRRGNGSVMHGDGGVHT
jgi:hypothetical protein